MIKYLCEQQRTSWDVMASCVVRLSVIAKVGVHGDPGLLSAASDVVTFESAVVTGQQMTSSVKMTLTQRS